MLVRSFLILFHYRYCLWTSSLYYVFFLLRWSETTSLRTSKFSGPSARLSIGKMGTDRGKWIIWRKTRPNVISPLQIPRGLPRAGTRFFAPCASWIRFATVLLSSCCPCQGRYHGHVIRLHVAASHFTDRFKDEWVCEWPRINLLAPELILAHPVYKMWIIQEPNTLELWHKLHSEEKKTESIYHV